jgi:hypothetical protein
VSRPLRAGRCRLRPEQAIEQRRISVQFGGQRLRRLRSSFVEVIENAQLRTGREGLAPPAAEYEIHDLIRWGVHARLHSSPSAQTMPMAGKLGSRKIARSVRRTPRWTLSSDGTWRGIATCCRRHRGSAAPQTRHQPTSTNTAYCGRGVNVLSSSRPWRITPQLDSGTSFHAPARLPSGSETISLVSSESLWSIGLSGY